jgi:hypothetical protein
MYTETQINVQGESQNAFEVYADEEKEQTIAFCFDEELAKHLSRYRNNFDGLLSALKLFQKWYYASRNVSDITREMLLKMDKAIAGAEKE